MNRKDGRPKRRFKASSYQKRRMAQWYRERAEHAYWSELEANGQLPQVQEDDALSAPPF